MGVEPTRFHVAIPEMDVLTFIRVGILGMLCAFVTILFCRGIHFTEAFMEKILPNTWLRAFTGGAVIVALTLLLGTRDYNGAGMAVIINAVENGQAVPYAFLLKILFTAITLGAEFKGGEVVPSFFVGATFGCAVGPLLGLPAGGALTGCPPDTPGGWSAKEKVSQHFPQGQRERCPYGRAVNCPLASIFLAAELFGGQGLLYFAVVCTLSYVLSGYSGLYSSQKMLYSKIKAQYINISTQK